MIVYIILTHWLYPSPQTFKVVSEVRVIAGIFGGHLRVPPSTALAILRNIIVVLGVAVLDEVGKFVDKVCGLLQFIIFPESIADMYSSVISDI